MQWEDRGFRIKMGIDYMNCDKCGAIFADCEEHYYCAPHNNHTFCAGCAEDFELNEEDEIIYCPICSVKCKECNKCKPVGSKTGMCLECLDWKMDELNK